MNSITADTLCMRRVLVADQLASGARVGTDGRYVSPPQPEEHARQLVRLLLGRSAVEGNGPWRQAIPGGQRTVWLQQAP